MTDGLPARTLHVPVPAGRWLHHRHGMTCQLPLRRLRVSITPAFLHAVERHCNGVNTWAEVSQKLNTQWHADEVDACLSTLAGKGMLVEAGQSLAAHARVGWTPQPRDGLLTCASDIDALEASSRQRVRAASAASLRPEPTSLMQLLSRRHSVRTFGDRPLRQQSIVNILGAMYGVLDDAEDRVRRTVPSGGALHGLQWFVALLRPIDRHPAGLYQVDFHASNDGAGALSLAARNGSPQDAWKTLLTPVVLSFAHAVIYPVVDLGIIGPKYGNRALTLAMLEAGHALQNGALAALDEEAATIVRGDTVEMDVLSLFGLDDSFYPLPSLVVGACPSRHEQLLAQAASRQVPVCFVPGHASRVAFATATAVAGPVELGGHTRARTWATGRSADAQLAATKAEAEAWERLGWSTPQQVERARFAELDRAVDPRRLVAHAARQYRRADFPFAPWSTRHRYPWIAGSRASDGASVWLMAHCVHPLCALQPVDARRPYTNANTSGVAAFTDAASAQTRALVELIERDAFARAWISRCSPPMLDDAGLAASIRHRMACIGAAGYALSVRLLPSLHLPVVAVFAQRTSAAFTSITTAAAFDLENAIDAALDETESRIQEAHDLPPLPRMAARDVTSARQHGDYYRTRAGFRSADWFTGNRQRLTRTDVVRSKAQPRDGPALVARLLDRGHEIFVCDLTPPGASIHQGRSPLHVHRVFSTGLVPLWFGYGLEPEISGADTGAAPIGPVLPLHPCT